MISPRRSRIQIDEHSVPDPQTPLDPTVLQLPGLGDVIVQQAHFTFVGERVDPEGNTRIMLVSGRGTCRCGCGAPGRAFASTPSAEEARVLAGRLVTVAEELERAAAERAAAEITKARQK